MKPWMLALGLAVLLSACSSTKLDTPPVEDKKGTVVQPNAGNQPGNNTVTGVTVGGADDAAVGPKGARIVYFDFDSYVVRPEAQPVIEGQARYLKANKASKVQLEGHTDEQGGREYNLALGQRRAEAVRKALTLLGVNDAQLEAVSFGKEKPADAGHGEAAFAKNRRVEITYR